MKFIIFAVLGVILLQISCTQGKSVKKISQKDESAVLNKKILGKSKPRAIIAIEIVDPNENSTKSRNSKRTIDSYLGYGYQQQNYHTPPPKYEVYKYSQHDIPPYKGPANFFTASGINSHNFNIQKSVSYNLPSITEAPHYRKQNLNNYYQPGTTLFTTVNNKGQLDGLSQNVPTYSGGGGGGQEPHVPVIILRVLPSQLADPSAILRPKLPQSHPLAATLNNVDIQSILQQYIQPQHYQQPPQQPQYHQAPQQTYYQESGYNYQQPTYQYQYQQQYHSGDGLLTHENYPKNTHTRVVFRQDKINNGAKDSSVPVTLPLKKNVETKTIKIHLPPGVDVQANAEQYYQQPNVQYYYSNQGNDQYYQQQDVVPPKTGLDYDEQQSSRYQYEEPSNNNYDYSQSIKYERTEEEQNYEETPSADEQPTTKTYNYHTHQKRKTVFRPRIKHIVVPDDADE